MGACYGCTDGGIPGAGAGLGAPAGAGAGWNSDFMVPAVASSR